LTDSSQQLQTETRPNALHRPSDIVPAPVTGALPYRRDDYPSSSLGRQSDSEEAQMFDLFLTDEDSVQTRHDTGSTDTSSPQRITESVPEMNTLSSLETRAEDVVRQITDVQERVTKDDNQVLSGIEPFNETLQQLNDQISSIRQYASSQQDRVEKLQTGYDWNIIRTFCLRIIRCIDNLDDRIERLPDDSGAMDVLSDIRDELLFALESSGVERFDLEHGSEFCGQERLAEAIKEKEISDNPELKGRIARVVKSGYQYIIDDENTKVVRTARIQLYG
jgi:molecular chaperone GrpE (heat shock protein)